MRITILGGSSFIGYWIKEEFREREPCNTFQIIDAPREGLTLIKRYKDAFISINSLSKEDIIKFSPSIIVISLYDLLSYSSLSYNVNNNNALINSLNHILEVSKKLKCKILLILNKNRYDETTMSQLGEKSYYQTYNLYNSFYYDYIKTFSNVYGISLKIILLPNIFGTYEPPESVISSLISKISNKELVKLSDGIREFIYIKRITPEIVDYALLDKTHPIVSFTTNDFIKVGSLYEMISNHLNKKCSVEIFDDKITFGEMVNSTEGTVIEIDTKVSEDLVYHLSFLKM